MIGDVLLVLNAGSSSLKFALYARDGLKPLLRGQFDEVGRGAARLQAQGARAEALREGDPPPAAGDHAALAAWLAHALATRLPRMRIVAAGHRVVHGGERFDAPTRIDADALAAIEALVPLAPHHQPQALACIRALQRQWPDVPQLACFDTAFHRSQPQLAQWFALPRELTASGILRYGFHGLSYTYIADVLPQVAGPRAEGRVIVAHLGHGASLCALRRRRSVATTMGFSVLDGLVMGRRCGRLDPGVVLYLQQQRGLSAEAVGELLHRRSGLLGVSGVSDDMRELEASDDPHAEEALELFAYRAAQEIGALASVLQGVDALVFTGGIGEHSAAMRARIAGRCGWLGAVLDLNANAGHAIRLHGADSRVDLWRIPTDEEVVVAQALEAMLGEAG